MKQYVKPELIYKKFIQAEIITTSDIGGTEEIVIDEEIGS